MLDLIEPLLDNRLFPPIIPAIVLLQVFFVSFVSFGGEVFRTVGLAPQEWAIVALLAALIISADLLRKLVRNRLFGDPVLPPRRGVPRPQCGRCSEASRAAASRVTAIALSRTSSVV